jgi:hypothetical protein
MIRSHLSPFSDEMNTDLKQALFHCLPDNAQLILGNPIFRNSAQAADMRIYIPQDPILAELLHLSAGTQLLESHLIAKDSGMLEPNLTVIREASTEGKAAPETMGSTTIRPR